MPSPLDVFNNLLDPYAAEAREAAQREHERDHPERETLLLAAAGAAWTLGPDHSATKALTRVAANMARVDLWGARLALRTLWLEVRRDIAEAAES